MKQKNIIKKGVKDVYDKKEIHNQIFNGVTSFQELNRVEGKMPKEVLTDDFTDADKVQGSSLEFWKHKEQKEVIGFFEEWATDNYGEHAVLNSGEDLIHLPNLMALNGKLKATKVTQGNKIKIVYLGEVKSKKSGRLYEDFDIFVKLQ